MWWCSERTRSFASPRLVTYAEELVNDFNDFFSTWLFALERACVVRHTNETSSIPVKHGLFLRCKYCLTSYVQRHRPSLASSSVTLPD
jgi:hypothetical protein